MTDPIPEGFVLSEDAARILDIEVRTLYRDRYTTRRYPRAYTVGRTLMWRRDELEAWAAENPRPRPRS